MSFLFVVVFHIELDLVSLATGYALPHLPRMPELRDRDVSSFSARAIKPSAIPYKDKTRERERQTKLLTGDKGYQTAQKTANLCVLFL